MSTRVEQLRELLLTLFLDNFPLKVVSLGVAIGVWVWVQSSLVVNRTVRVRVEYGWPNELVRVEDPPKRLALTLEGPQGLLAGLDPRQLSMTVDLSDREEGENTIDFTNQLVNGVPQGITVQQVSPMETELILEPPMKKVVSVDPTIIGAPARDWQVVRYRVEPETVTLIGPKSQIENISKVPTDVVDINDLREDRTFQIPLTPGETIRSLWEGPIDIIFDVEPLIADKGFQSVRVLVNTPGWVATPETVTVRLQGPADALRDVDGSRLAVRAEVPAGISTTANVAQLQYTPDAPSGLIVLNTGPPSVQVVELSPERIVLKRLEVPQ